MKRQVIACATALSLVVTSMSGTAVEARNKKNNLIPLLLGAAALGIILNQQSGANPLNLAPAQRPSYDEDEDDDGWDNQRHVSRDTRRQLIPAECLTDVTVGGRNRQVVSARCMSEFTYARSLPEDCAFDVRSYSGVRTVYGQQCLREYGYEIERARY